MGYDGEFFESEGLEWKEEWTEVGGGGGDVIRMKPLSLS